MFNTIDLFAGAGGLSLGFMQSGKYDIKVAFENNPCMQKTYKKNHPGVDVLGDVCKADYSEIVEKYGKIDIVIGGPPCQGFSNANRQKNHAVNQNNMLVKQFIRAVRELKPKAFIMENVSMLASNKHRFFFNTDDVNDVKKYRIPMTLSKLLLLEKEYLFPNARAVVQDEEKVFEELWSEELYAVLNVVYKTSEKNQKAERALKKHKEEIVKRIEEQEKRSKESYIGKKTVEAFDAVKKYYAGTTGVKQMKEKLAPAIQYQRMLGKAKELFANKIIVDSYTTDGGLIANIYTYSVFDYLKCILGTGKKGYVMDAKVLCAADFGAPQKRERFVVMGVQKSLVKTVKLPSGVFRPEQYRTVSDAIKDLESVTPVISLNEDKGTPLRDYDKISTLGESLRDSDVLFNHIVTNTGDDAMTRFKALKQGENFHALDESLKTNTYSDVSRTQNTIYLRLDYNQPCGTVVNVRKSMWVHPTLDRAISVREAARLQTFPDSFIFCGTKDNQYQQVGNAVPPILARAIAENLANTLKQ